MARQQHSPEEKSKLVLEAIRGERTINEIAAENNIHPNMLSKWKREAESQLYTLFQDNLSKERKAQKAHESNPNPNVVPLFFHASSKIAARRLLRSTTKAFRGVDYP